MIKINLAKSIIKKSEAQADSGADIDSVDKELKRQGIVKIVIMLIFPLGLYVYESQTIPTKQQELSSNNSLLTQLTETNNKAKSAVSEIKKFKEDQAKIQAQIGIIENLKKGRMNPIRVLDSIQRMIPSKVWLSSIDLNVNKKITIQGLSTTDHDLTSFLDSLSRSIFLKDVVLVRSSEEVDESGSNLKKFEISSLMEEMM